MGCLKLFKCSRVAPDQSCSRIDRPEDVPTQQQSASAENIAKRPRGSIPNGENSRQQAFTLLDKQLSKIFSTAQLSFEGTGLCLAEGQKSPASLAGLTGRLQAAVGELQQQGTVSAVLASITKTSDKLLKLQRAQHQQEVQLYADTTPSSPAADALVSAISCMVFAQVVLDTAAVLQQRHQHLLQLLHTLGFSGCSSLCACLRPATKAIIACIVLGSSSQCGEVKVGCTVRRRAAFWDALTQLPAPTVQQQESGVEHKLQDDETVRLVKLFPRFLDEHLSLQQQADAGSHHPHSVHAHVGCPGADCVVVEAGEGHGPRKEFFEAVAQNWTTTTGPQKPALLVHLKGSGTWWINAALQSSTVLQQAYWAVGWIIAQALTNRCTLGLPVSPVLFHLLLLESLALFQPSLDLLEQHDAAAATSIQSVLKLPAQQFQQLLQVEQLPSNTSRQQYVLHAVRQLLVGDVEWQLVAIKKGFAAGIDIKVLQECCLHATDLAVAICGGTPDDAADFKVQKAFRVVLEDDGEDADNIAHSSNITLQCLWAVLDAWNVGRKKAFVKFVTGTDRLPAHPGSEQLVVSFPFVACGLRDQQHLLGTLPQSHTCSNTLELPDYAEALVATSLQLKEEWAAACRDHSMESRHGVDAAEKHGKHTEGALVAADLCPMLVQECCRVLHDRLEVAISCTSYGLDHS